ncbi:MAG: cation:proton antiporter [Acidobacteriota bacterium]|nr:cation:proton antiporter [Acidobacteriota bacterium]
MSSSAWRFWRAWRTAGVSPRFPWTSSQASHLAREVCVTLLTKFITGYLAARRIGVDHRGRVRAATALVARGEFSIIIAGLGASNEPRIEPFAAVYVLMLAVVCPLLTRAAK